MLAPWLLQCGAQHWYQACGAGGEGALSTTGLSCCATLPMLAPGVLDFWGLLALRVAAVQRSCACCCVGQSRVSCQREKDSRGVLPASELGGAGLVGGGVVHSGSVAEEMDCSWSSVRENLVSASVKEAKFHLLWLGFCLGRGRGEGLPVWRWRFARACGVVHWLFCLACMCLMWLGWWLVREGRHA